MYIIKITYDTGDSFHHETNCEKFLDLEFIDIKKAEQALLDIEDHYAFYILNKQECCVSEKQFKNFLKNYKKKSWYYGDRFPFYSLLLENDEGLRVAVSTFWCGYFAGSALNFR